MKFWTEADIPWLTAERAKKFRPESPDNEMFLHIGFFISCYAVTELRLSTLLAKATQITNLRSFDLLTRGMDVRVKIERLRRACEKRPPIGPNLSARLAILDGTMRTFRNHIAHSATVPSSDKLSISFASLSAMPVSVTNRHPDQEISAEITTLELFEYCAWLRFFQIDLREAHRGLAHRGMFETDPPHAPLLRGSDQPHAPPKPFAKPNRRGRKRDRKGQTPRRKQAVP
jgi:hypothetical protein